LSALLRGDWREAWHRNALVVLFLPLLLCYAAAAYRRACQHRTSAFVPLPQGAGALLLLATIAFGIVRNLR
jgi:hypothetical protein